MSSPSRDTQLAVQAARILIDDRDPVADMSTIMVTLETMVSTVLLAVMNQKPDAAIGMLHEGLVPRVEFRIALFASRRGRKE